MGFWDSIKKGYANIDRKIGGVLPGGYKRPSTTTQPSQSSQQSSSQQQSSLSNPTTPIYNKPSSGGSSGGSSSGTSKLFNQTKSSYEINTQTYTDELGQKYSMSLEEAKKSGANITLSGKLISSGSGKISSQTEDKSVYSKLDEKLGGYLPGGQSPQDIQQKKIQQQIEQKEEEIKSGKIISPSANIRDQPWFIDEQIKDSNETRKVINLKKTGTKAGDILAGAWGGTWFNAKKSYVPGEEGKEIKESFSEIDDITKESLKFTLTRSAYEDYLESKQYGGKNKYGGAGTTLTDVAIIGVGEGIMATGVGAFIYQGMTKKEEWARDVDKIEKQAVIDVAKINVAVENIEGATSKLTQTGYNKQADQFSKDVETFNKQAEDYASSVEKFNELYAGGKLTRSEYNKAIKEQQNLQQTQKNLETTYSGLSKKQESLEKTYSEYDKTLQSNIENLEKQGVKISKDAEGQYSFSTDALEKKVSTTSSLLWKSYKDPEGNLTWKNYAYGGAYIGREAILGVAGGYVIGASGVGAKVGSVIAKGGRVAKVSAVTLGVGMIAVGTGVSAYGKAKEFEQLKMSKIEGAILGGSTALAKVGGFFYGTYRGTKVYYSRVEQNILAGKYTKSVAEVRQGAKIGSKGVSKQLGRYETKIKGTDYKIDTSGKVTGRYAGKTGTSKVELYSKFSGKAPKGMPKSFQTRGETLEHDSLVRARLFTKSSKGKYWYKQDIILKRATLSQKQLAIEGKPGFEGYAKLEELKFVTGVKTEGPAIKVGKTLPKDIFTRGEKYIFRVQEGDLKFGAGSEFAKAKPDSLFGTRQYVLYTPEKEIAGVKIQKFDSIAQSRGANVDLLKASLKDKILVFNEKTKTLGSISLNKRGQVMLPKLQAPTPKIDILGKLEGPNMQPAKVDLRPLIGQQLKNILPSVLAQQEANVLVGLPAVTGITQLKTLIKTQQFENQAIKMELKEALLPKIKQINKLDPRVLQVDSLVQVQTPIQRTPQITSPAVSTGLVTTPVMPTPFVPPTGFFGFDVPEFGGFSRPRGGRRATRKGMERATYVEDFTSKAVGFDPLEISEKQAQKILKKSLTGLELRRAVIVK